MLFWMPNLLRVRGGSLHVSEVLESQNSTTQRGQVVPTLPIEQGGVDQTPHIVSLYFSCNRSTLHQNKDQHWKKIYKNITVTFYVSMALKDIRISDTLLIFQAV